jgi:hypothetical protein
MLIAGTFFGFGWNRPLIANAATAGDFTITATGGGAEPTIDVDYSYASNVLTILSTKDMTISGSTTTDGITTTSGLAAVLTIDNISIDGSTIYTGLAFNVNGGSLHLTLKGANILQGAGGAPNAGLSLRNGANLIIDAEAGASLTATGGGSGGAGIGAGSGSAAGNITINGGEITATGKYSAGIGGSSSASAPAGDISINNSKIEATGLTAGAGIGGGTSGAGDISIDNSEITATGNSGAGIGSGNSDSTVGDITINNSKITAMGNNGAGIGSSGSTSSAGDITISYSEINATVGENRSGAGIGAYIGSVSDITITDSDVTATGGTGGGAGIGGGTSASAVGDIIISGGNVTAMGGSTGGAGIGGGKYNWGNFTIGNISINGGTITATGGTNSQDIGNGYVDTYQATATSITINGGSIWATNGKVAYGASPTGPKNSVNGGELVYPNTLTIGSPAIDEDTAVTAGIIDGVECTTNSELATGSPYGINGVKTNASGQVCFWLPQNSEETAGVSLEAEGSVYVNKYVRAGNSETQTLKLLSTDATLKSLSVSGAALNPAFNANTINYSANVPNATSQVTIAAATSDANATVIGTGAKTLNVGANKFTVTVTAENGSVKTYIVTVTRAAPIPPVYPKVTSIKTPMKKMSIVVKKGKLNLKNLVGFYTTGNKPIKDSKLTWTSSKPKVATVNRTGFTGELCFQ